MTNDDQFDEYGKTHVTNFRDVLRSLQCVFAWRHRKQQKRIDGSVGSSLFFAFLEPSNKAKHPESGGARREIICWDQAEESDAKGGRFRRLIPANDPPTRTTRRAGVFLLYRTYLWNKQQVMPINLTTWSTMQYHVVVDHVVFHVIHSQVRCKSV